jgi:hypothetical protein
VAKATEFSDHNASNTTLLIHFKDRGDNASLTFTKEELYAMWCIEEGMSKTVTSP